MKEYSITVMLSVPVTVKASCVTEALLEAEDIAYRFLDDSHVDSMEVDSEREI
jgi:hypothetical protein